MVRNRRTFGISLSHCLTVILLSAAAARLCGGSLPGKAADANY